MPINFGVLPFFNEHFRMYTMSNSKERITEEVHILTGICPQILVSHKTSSCPHFSLKSEQKALGNGNETLILPKF